MIGSERNAHTTGAATIDRLHGDADAVRDASPDFVVQGSVVRRIWGDGDMVLLVFAGAAAEFALNRAVDWLFFTGKLPDDPIGRLFSTAGYSQHIVFADAATATRTLDRIRAVHEAVERERGLKIPDWAHRDVLYMLIAYSERAHELLAGPLNAAQQRELYDVFYRVGSGLRIPDLPPTYAAWDVDRERHMRDDLLYGKGTAALYAQYRKHLGAWRYHFLRRIQAMLVPAHVRGLLRMKSAASLRPLARLYPILVRAGLRPIIQWLLMPAQYLAAVRGLDHRSQDTSHAMTGRSQPGSNRESTGYGESNGRRGSRWRTTSGHRASGGAVVEGKRSS